MAIINKQLRLSIGFDEAQAYHAPDKFGFFTIASKVPAGPRLWQERSYRLDRLPAILDSLSNQPDTYISQAEFASPNRRIANLARISLLWVDLDVYNIPALAGTRVESIAEQVLIACEDSQIPPPSVIIDSGRGLYAKWYLESPIPARALSRWQLVQNLFCLKLKAFGADPRARDAARVLRVVGSMHAASGREVRVLWQNRTPTHGGSLANDVVSYAFDMLADDQLPLTRERLTELRAERELQKLSYSTGTTSTGNSLTLVTKRNTKGLKPFIPSQLAWDRYHDIVKLMEIRGWQEGAPEGQRDMPVFLCASLMSQAVVAPKLELEVAEIAKKFAPTWTPSELANCVSSVMTRNQMAFAGEKLEYRGRLVDPRYIFKTDTLIALLEITPAEEAQLTTIISRDEAKRRDAARARRARAAAGAASRTQYEADANHRRQQALQLRNSGHSWADVGKAIGTSATAARLLASRASSERSSPSVYM